MEIFYDVSKWLIIETLDVSITCLESFGQNEKNQKQSQPQQNTVNFDYFRETYNQDDKQNLIQLTSTQQQLQIQNIQNSEIENQQISQNIQSVLQPEESINDCLKQNSNQINKETIIESKPQVNESNNESFIERIEENNEQKSQQKIEQIEIQQENNQEKQQNNDSEQEERMIECQQKQISNQDFTQNNVTSTQTNEQPQAIEQNTEINIPIEQFNEQQQQQQLEQIDLQQESNQEKQQNNNSEMEDSTQINEQSQIIEQNNEIKELIEIDNEQQLQQQIEQDNNQDKQYNNEKVQETLNLLNKIFDTSYRWRGVDAQYKNFVTEQMSQSEFINYYFPSKKNQYKKQIQGLKQELTGYRRIRGDGNCFYTAFAFQYFQILLTDKQRREQFEQKISTLKVSINYQQLKIENNEVIPKLFLDEFRKINDEKELLDQIGDPDKLFYGLSIIVLRNYIINLYEKNEEIRKLGNNFIIPEILEWEKECNTNELIITLLAKELKIIIIVHFFDLKNNVYNKTKYGEDDQNLELPQIILLLAPGHYQVGIPKK